MKDITKKYTNGEITIIWKPAQCIHSAICFRGLPGVFDPRRRPWVEMENASPEKIMEQIRQCPSGALSYEMNDGTPATEPTAATTKVEVSPDGPLLVHGDLMVKDREGNVTRKEKMTAFCRCGHSANKPYCDGSHRKVDFKG